MRDVLQGYSRAMYSNWLLHRALQLLIDAGEGVHLTLGTSIFAPSVVAITHGHSDHVLGLAGLAGARRFGKGATSKPWTILYPAESRGVEASRALIAELWRGVEFPISWVPVKVGDEHRLSQHRSIQAINALHVPGEPAIGYRVLENRRRLRPQFAALPQQEIEQRARKGREDLMEEYRHVVFAHSGDTMPMDVEMIREADVLVHDATFLASAERREPSHATSEEALVVATQANVRALVLNHLSIRYPRETALPRLREQVAASGFQGECWLLDEGEFVDLQSMRGLKPAPPENRPSPI